MSLSRNYVVSFVEGPDYPYSIILERKDDIGCLLFSNNTICELTKEEVDSLRSSRGSEKICDAYACMGIFSLAENEDWLVLVNGFSLVGKFSLADVFRITSVTMISLRERQRNDADYLGDVRKFLSSGFFYFSPSSLSGYDLTRSIQRQTLSQATYPSPFLDPMSRSFFWNRNFWRPFLLSGVASVNDWLVRVICGGIEMRTLYVESNTVRVLIISRLSCERVGTRFSCRGSNDDGHVANFVETEQLIVKDENELSSFVQIRGSVPLLWEQAGHNLGKHFVRLSRGFEACAPAFERHFTRLLRQYKELTVVNLLHAAERKSNRLICEGGEPALNMWYQEHHRSSAILQHTEHVTFDFHAEWKRSQEKCLVKLWERLAPALTKYGFFHYADGLVRTEQNGVIRTNCIDCLDRTNCVQSMLAIQVLDWQLGALKLNERSRSYRAFVDTLKQMWTQNGDHCSRIYAGTGAMFGGKGKYIDVATAANRTVQGGLLDSSKNSAIHMILKSGCPTGELGDRAFNYIQEYTPYCPIWLCREMVLRYPLYSVNHPLRIFVGSWNVNGGQRTRSIAYKEDSIHDWLTDFIEATQRDRPELLDPGKDYSQPVDIYAIGFQEIVDLNAQNIVSADTKNQEEWAQRLIKTISRSPEYQYIYLASIQLVGVCLIVFIRPHLAPYLRDVEVSSVKTGLGGATGNKGGVAVRFRLHGSTICFVCGHLAAGQNKVSDRNSDLAEIANKLSFSEGQTVWNHDYVYLFGDFNYRIGQLGNQMVRDLVAARQYRELSNYEQLRLEVFKAHEALDKFKEETGGDADQLPTWQRVLSTFSEGNIDFAPTYKYDIFSDDYDTSEKNRIPAWTDRILWTRRPLFVEESLAVAAQAEWNGGHLLLYNRAELRTSDHRPVYALFEVDIFHIDEKKMKQTLLDFTNTTGPLDGSVVITPMPNCEEDANSDDVRMIVSSCGQISTMRYVNNKAIVTFSDRREAADALKLRTNTMFSFEPKFVNGAWFEAIAKIIATNADDSAALSSNKLLAEPVEIASLTASESPYPSEEDFDNLCGDDPSIEPNYELTTTDNFLSIGGNKMHLSKSADNLRRTTPPPRPPPPQVKKPLDSQSAAFIATVHVSQPAVVEKPLLVKGQPFLPKVSNYLKLTTVGAVHTSGVLEDSFFNNGEEDSPKGSSVKESRSIDELLEMTEGSSVSLPAEPLAPRIPPSRPPPPMPTPLKTNAPEPSDETSASNSRFYLGNPDSMPQELSAADNHAPLTSWPDENPSVNMPPAVPPPRPQNPVPLTSWPDESPSAGAPQAVPPPRTQNPAPLTSWPDENPAFNIAPAAPPPRRAPPALPSSSGVDPWGASDLNPTASWPTNNQELTKWPDDDPEPPQVPTRAPPPAPRTMPDAWSVGHNGEMATPPPPTVPRRAPPTISGAAVENAPPPPPRAPPRMIPSGGAPPPPPPRRG